MTKKPNVLVVAIDTQYDFMMPNGRLPVAGADRIILPSIRYLAGLDPEKIAAILFTFDTHDRATYIGSPENLGNPEKGEPGFPIHCEKGTPGWQNVLNVHAAHPAIQPYSLEKGVFDMWEESRDNVWVSPINDMNGEQYNTCENREEFISRIKQSGIDTVRIFGVAADFCVRWAIAGFLAHDFKVEVVADLTAGILRDIAQTVADEFPEQVTLITSDVATPAAA